MFDDLFPLLVTIGNGRQEQSWAPSLPCRSPHVALPCITARFTSPSSRLLSSKSPTYLRPTGWDVDIDYTAIRASGTHPLEHVVEAGCEDTASEAILDFVVP